MMGDTSQQSTAGGSMLNSITWRIPSAEDLRRMSWFALTNYTNFFAFIFFMGFAIYQARSKMKVAEQANRKKQSLPAPEFPDIQQLDGFSWADEEPVKLRTFKLKHHLTMTFEKLDPSQLILMDKNYPARLQQRKRILKEHHNTVVAVHDEKDISPAIRELYTWLLGTYLPLRYPGMFKLHHAHFETGDMHMLENLVTKEILPAQANSTSKATLLLENLGRTVDEDFLLLLPEQDKDVKHGKYVLQAYVTACLPGLSAHKKLGQRLADAGDTQVGSLDSYFAEVEVGQYVVRHSWSVSTNSDLFGRPGPSGDHATTGEVIEQLDKSDVDKMSVRCERQTLHRLPKSEALVLTYKTYMYLIEDIKKEGLGENLAQAIDDLKVGSDKRDTARD